MFRRLVAGLTLSLVVLAGTAMGSVVYNYTETGMDGTDWSLVDNGKWNVWAVQITSEDRYRIDYDPYHWFNKDGMGNGNKIAIAWAAPLGESITKVEFTYTYNANPALFTPVVYEMGATETQLSEATPIVWSATEYGYCSGTTSITFTADEDVQKVALGLTVPSWGYYSYFVEFSDVVITTVPEPATLGLLTFGLLLYRRQK